MKTINSYREIISIFLLLIQKDMLIFLSDLRAKWLQACISVVSLFVIFGYLMPQMGLRSDYSLFMVIGGVACFGFYEMVGRIASFISDLNGERVISYLLILPLPPFWAIHAIAIAWAGFGFCLTALLFPVAKLLLMKQWHMSLISPISFLWTLITINLFFGYFALWLASLIQQVKNTGWIWIMIINPLYMLGCYYCPWKTIYELSPLLAYLDFLNPLTYVMEAVRSTTLGSEGFLPCWLCLSMLWLFILVFSWHTCVRLKKRLDFV